MYISETQLAITYIKHIFKTKNIIHNRFIQHQLVSVKYSPHWLIAKPYTYAIKAIYVVEAK